jgi:oligoribonuclease (3'-5' exoribonuclease)
MHVAVLPLHPSFILWFLQLLGFVVRHTDAGEARLAGNSVHVDMHFLRRCMPRLFAHLSHR